MHAGFEHDSILFICLFIFLLFVSSVNDSLYINAMMKVFKMIKDSREKETQIKQEEGTIDYTRHQMSKRLCSSFPNQRMVRLSQADHFGGKDRHSKVSTLKGLRDRRVRLSIPTAIQVYDLQDKLGLNQPSKVVDWLINAAQNEIDKLPSVPLLAAGSSFIQFPQSDARNMDEQNLNGSSIRAQAFSINTDPFMLLSNSYNDDITSFSKPPLNSFNSYHEIESYERSHTNRKEERGGLPPQYNQVMMAAAHSGDKGREVLSFLACVKGNKGRVSGGSW